MSEEKYGFVYIWYDRKHKRFYVGCHWGKEDDGYICSSKWMKSAFKRRPQDFKRRILKRVYENVSILLDEEHRWLSMIKPHELRKKYYNLTQYRNGHWTSDQNTKTIKEKISTNTKAAMQRPEVRQNYEEGIKNRKLIQTEEYKKNRSDAAKKAWEKRSPKANRKVVLKRGSPELSKIYSEASHKRWRNHRAKYQEQKENSII